MLARWHRRRLPRVILDLDVFTPTNARAVTISWR